MERGLFMDMILEYQGSNRYLLITPKAAAGILPGAGPTENSFLYYPPASLHIRRYFQKQAHAS
jgi:hypothetical protein